MVIEGVQFRDLGAMLGTLAGTLLIGVTLIYRAYIRLKLEKQTSSTETATLKMLDAAVEHWKGLYETAWAQVAKERELREAAEKRARQNADQIELLRGEVAELKRELDRLTAMVRQKG